MFSAIESLRAALYDPSARIHLGCDDICIRRGGQADVNFGLHELTEVVEEQFGAELIELYRRAFTKRTKDLL